MNADAGFAAQTRPGSQDQGQDQARSARPVATVTSGAVSAATRPGTVTMGPAVPSDTSRSAPTG